MKLKNKFTKMVLDKDIAQWESKCVEIADEHAINFAEWISEKTTTIGGGLWGLKENELFVHKNQLLEIYKKEKGL